MQDIAVSYTMGAVGGLVYLRLLHKSLDAIGGSGKDALAGGLSSQRLLIPIILVMAFNRLASCSANVLSSLQVTAQSAAGYYSVQ